jgi:hypothetical protein
MKKIFIWIVYWSEIEIDLFGKNTDKCGPLSPDDDSRNMCKVY